MTARAQKAAFFAGLFLLCMSTLMLQIIQTRILSVVSLYYMAFFSISMAMLGLTAGALIVYFRLNQINGSNVSSYLSKISTAFALSVAFCFLIQLASPLMMVKWATLVIVWLKIIVLLAIPFVLAGIAVSIALTRSPYPVGVTYGVDLVGAAFGCLAVLALLNWIDGPSAMFIAAALAAIAGTFFSKAALRTERTGTILDWAIFSKPGWVATGLVILAAANASINLGFQPISAKFGIIEKTSDFDFVKWNSFSRIAVQRARITAPHLWGPSPALPEQTPQVNQRQLDIDGFAGTTMPNFDGDVSKVEFLKFDITNLAYAARHGGRAAVIGVGSGRDLLSAYLFGFRNILGVELNPIFVDLLNNPAKLRKFAGIADLPGISFVVDDGRSWFARTDQKFDLIQMSMIDTFAATGVGAFSLSENGLYTVEGWRIFLSALNPTGLFTVSRWHSTTAPVEIGRTVSLAVAALFSLGVKNPSDHIYIAGVKNLATMIISREPLLRSDLDALNDAVTKLRFEPLVVPGQSPEIPIFKDLLSARDVADLNARAAAYFLDVSAPTDARPFFFNQLRLFSLEDVQRMIGEIRTAKGPFSESGVVITGNLLAFGTLFIIIGLSLIVVLFTIVLPARSSIFAVDRRLAFLGSCYFLLIGLGFMFVEIGLIQRISTLLGHPVYAMSIGLFSIILSTGLGSLLSESIVLTRRNHFLLWLGLLGAYLVLLPTWLPQLTGSALQASGLLQRAVASVAVILPAGLLMGFGFPCGMRLVMARDPRPTPWFWGVNGAAGVLAAGLAVVSSISFSIDTTIRTGGVLYLLLAPVALMLLGIKLDPSRKAA